MPQEVTLMIRDGKSSHIPYRKALSACG